MRGGLPGGHARLCGGAAPLLATAIAFGCGSGDSPPAAAADPDLVDAAPPNLGLPPAAPGVFVAPRSAQAACVDVPAPVEVTLESVDIVLLLDNSNSMADELEAVERSINTDFAQVLSSSEVDYRVILLSRHRRLARTRSLQSTFVCVESPLSALPSCQALERTEPGFSNRFFHYSLRLGSKDSLSVAVDTFQPPFQLGRDEFGKAPSGWSGWLRPGARPVFVAMTDDDSEMSAESFVAELAELSPERFGTLAEPKFIFHSIVGIDQKADPVAAYQPEEPLIEATCVSETGSNRVENSGPTYQELSRMSGGLRFPLCEFEHFDVVFRRIAQSVVQSRSVACEFPVPEPPANQVLDLGALSISATLGDSEEVLTMQQVAAAGACRPGAFFLEADMVQLCPAACEQIRQNPEASVSVLFGCDNVLR